MCFCLLLQGSGIAQASRLAPKKTFVSRGELEAARLDPIPDSGESTDRSWPRFVEGVRGSVSEAGDALARWLRELPANAAEHPAPVRVAQAGGILPLPARLMSAFLASSSRGQSGPPSPPGLGSGEVEPTPPEEMARLVEKATTGEIPLLAGWNLISLPQEPVDSDPASVFADVAGQLAKIEAYDACDTADPWEEYDPADPAGSDLTAINHRRGVWVKATTALILPAGDTPPATTTIELCEGWNLIGFPAGQPRYPHAALSSIAGKWQRVFAYDAFDPEDPWEVFDPAVPDWANDLRLMHPGRGYWVLASEAATLEIRNEGPPPTVAISSPADLAVITQPTEILGTVESDRLESWTLTSRPIGDGDAVTLATGNAPVSGGTLANFDPTLLLNGLYELELTARDVQGQQVSESIAVSVEGQMKIGHFTLSFVDLRVPVSGLDIEIVRTYDCRDLQQRDFGVGWSLDVRQGSYRNNRPPGDGWQLQTGFIACDTALESKSHVTVVRLSDQEVYRFALRLVSGVPRIGGGCSATAEFEFIDGPLPGTTLEILGNDQVFQETPSSNRVLDEDTFATYEPQHVRLRTRDGRIFELDLTEGVTKLEDLNGNHLAITPAGISHSSGESIDFTRDAGDRIIEIADPRSATMSYGYDAAGDLVAFTDRVGNTTTMTYDDRHGLVDILDPLGNRTVRSDYDESGRLIATTDAAGRVISFEHDLAARREVITDRLGFVQVMEYDARGNVVREIDKLGNVTQRTFDTEDNFLTETDPLARTTTFAYTAENDLASTIDPLGNTTVFTYDVAGRVLTTTDPRGNVITNTYDAVGNPLSTTDPLGNVTTFTYDATGNLLTQTDAQGNLTTLVYDGRGNLTRQTDPLGGQADYTYNAVGEVVSVNRIRTAGTGSETLTTTFTRDDMGRMLSETAPDGSVKTNAYDALGRAVAATGELGRTTSMAYDSRGNLASTTFPDGTALVQVYDAESREIGLTSRAGNVIVKVMDAMGRHLSTTMPDGAATGNTYDAAGQLIRQTAANGSTLQYVYDAAGRQISFTDPSGTVTKVYDAVGNQIASTDQLGNTTTIAYDALNRGTQITYPDGTSVQTAYDELGRRASRTDQAGNVTLFRYDAVGRLATVTDPLGQTTQYSYDELGSLISQTDAEGRSTSFTYDRLGRRTSRTYPGGAVESFTYHADGTVASRTDPNGATTHYNYDVNKRLIRRSYPDGNDVTFTYTANGQRASYSDDLGLTAYTYDTRDRLTSVTHPDGRSLSYTYDGLGKRTSMTALVGDSTFTTTYGYDALSRPATVVDHQGGTTTYGYDATGNLASFAYPNGVNTAYTFDRLNRLVNLETEDAAGSVLQGYGYTLSAAGNRTRIDEASGISRQYTYDALNRVTRDRVEDAASTLLYQEDFVYDSVGNRLTLTRDEGAGAASTAYAYDPRDRLLSQGAVSYGWDVNGNRTSKSGLNDAAYSWDYENRLAAVTLGDGSEVRFRYDPDGVLVRREVMPAGGGPPVVTDYLNDTGGRLSHVVVESVGPAVDTVYTRAGGHLISLFRPDSDTTRYYHADGLGSVRVLTDASGTVTDSYDYTAFGALMDHVGTDPQPYQFAGEPFEPNSSFSYHRARWLDTAVGRFPSADPLLGNLPDPASLHRYLYANADPVGRVDPTGQLSSAVSAGLAALTIGLVIAGIAGVTFYSLALRNIPKEGIFNTPPEAIVVGLQWGFNTEPLTRTFKHPLVFGILAGLMAFTFYPGGELLVYQDKLIFFGTLGVAVGVPVGGHFGGLKGLDGYFGLAFDTNSGKDYPGHNFCTALSPKPIPGIYGFCFSNNQRTYSATIGRYGRYGNRIVSAWTWASEGYSVPYSAFGFELPAIPGDIVGVRSWADEFLDRLLERYQPLAPPR